MYDTHRILGVLGNAPHIEGLVVYVHLEVVLLDFGLYCRILIWLVGGIDRVVQISGE